MPEILQHLSGVAEAQVHVFRVQPGGACVLLQIADLCLEFRRLTQALFRRGDLFQHVVNRQADAQVRIRFGDLADVVPLVRIIDHIQKRSKPCLFACPVNDRRSAPDHFVVDSVADVSRRRDRYQHRLFPGAQCAFDDLVLPHALFALPGAQFVAHRPGRVQTVRLLFGEGDRHRA